jgi:hypothetical protein
MVKKIIATMNEVDWARERKNPKFIPDKEQNQK